MPKGKIWKDHQGGIATPTHSWDGKYGNCVVWAIDDKRFVTTSSADHVLDDFLKIAERNVFGLTADPEDMSGVIKETVAFWSDREGRFMSRDVIATFFTEEAHYDTMKFAGFTPYKIPENLPKKDKPNALF